MNTQQHTCVGCIWEDACRAADVCCTWCSDYWAPIDEYTYLAHYYFSDVADRVAVYCELVEEQQA